MFQLVDEYRARRTKWPCSTLPLNSSDDDNFFARDRHLQGQKLVVKAVHVYETDPF